MIEFPEIADAPNFTPPSERMWMFEHPSTWPFWVFILLGISLILVAFGVYLALRGKNIEQPPPPPLASHVLAMTLLEDLRPRATSMPASELAVRITEIVRTYLHRQFGILARFRTTQEILAQRRDQTVPPPAPAIRVFEDLLMQTDSATFGGKVDEPQGLIDDAINAIRQSREHLSASAVA